MKLSKVSIFFRIRKKYFQLKLSYSLSLSFPSSNLKVSYLILLYMERFSSVHVHCIFMVCHHA